MNKHIGVILTIFFLAQFLTLGSAVSLIDDRGVVIELNQTPARIVSGIIGQPTGSRRAAKRGARLRTKSRNDPFLLS